MISDLLYRVRAVVRRNRVERELDDELRYHVEREVEKLEGAGVTRNEARRRARLAFGGEEQIKEECRDARGTTVMESFWRDLQYAGRVLRTHPGFTAVAVLSIGLGIGATTSIFTVINAVLLRTLPVREPANLMVAYWKTDAPLFVSSMNNIDRQDPATGQQLHSTFPLMAVHDLNTATSDGLELFGFYIPGRVGLSDGATTYAAHCTLVTGNFFEALGARVALGRPLTGEDDRSGAAVAVVTYDFWQHSLQGDASILGKAVRVNGVPATVVGVSAPGFHGIASAGWGGPTDVLLPLGAVDSVLPREFRFGKPKTAPNLWWVQLMARRKAGISTDAAEARLTARFRGMLSASAVSALQQARNPRMILLPGGNGLGTLRDRIERPLMILFGVVAVVLLLACINVANLQLARSAARAREVAVRLSLGASRPRIVRQLLTESMLLSFLGALLGLFFAVGGSRFIAARLTANFDSVSLDLKPDLQVLGFAMLLSVASAVLFGLVPALKASRANIAPTLKGGCRAPGMHRSSWPSGGITGRAMIVVQVALSVLLLAGSGQLLRTLDNLGRLDAGFAREKILTFRLDAGQLGYGPQQVGPLYDRMLETIRATPGVVSAAALSHPLIAGGHNGTDLSTPTLEGGRAVNVWMNTVSPEFFQTMGMPIVEGRPLTVEDNDASAKAIVLNQAAARRFFAGRPAVGQVLLRHEGKVPFQVTVVGVARDAKYDSLRKAPVPTVFVPWAQAHSLFTGRAFAVRTAGDPAAMTGAVREAVLRANRDLVMSNIKTQTRLIEESLYQERLYALLLTVFGAFALVLAAIGLNGVTAYSTARRTAELGLRMALGARTSQILSLILRQVLSAVALGIVAGVLATWATSRWIASLLFGVQRIDPLSIALVLLLLATVASIAAIVPAWRAARFDPMAALRAE